MMLRAGLAQERSLFVVAVSINLLATLCLFDFGGFWTLMLADLLIFGFSNATNGIAEGWGCRAALEKTSFSLEKFRFRSNIAISFVRILAPPMARVPIHL